MNPDPAPQAPTPGEVPSSRERHSRKCAICTHPDRQAIDEAFLHWSRNDQIVKDYDVPSLSSLYRHAHATGLWLRRRTKIRFALDRIIEKAGETRPNAYAVIRAIQISCRFADDGTYVEPTKQVISEHRTVNSVSNHNRKEFRLETARTPKKQAANPNSNREPLRLETGVTPTKQTPTTSSNRENKAPFSEGARTIVNAEIQKMLIGKQ
jgi:hypothetical protein